MVRKATSETQDRRRNPRYLAYMPIEIRRRKRGSKGCVKKTYNAYCIDISSNGIRFATAELFQLGETLELTLGAPDGGDEITCEAEVVRVARAPQHYEVAAKIAQVVTEAEPSPASAARKA